MIATAAFTVFALGLRHGADPDHLAAIDNLTRNSAQRSRLSRFSGALFAGGHTVMVLSIAALVGIVGAHLGAQSARIETTGTAISIAVLVALAVLNIRQLQLGQTDRVAGLKTRLLPAALRSSTSAWMAVPVGLLFGFGFETSSQIAAYALSFGANAGVTGALVVGATFCVGMVCTDTLDSLMVHRLVSYRSGLMPTIMRTWIISVTLFALIVAAYEFAQLCGWTSPVPDLAVSMVLVSGLLAVFLWVYLATRSSRRASQRLEHVT